MRKGSLLVCFSILLGSLFAAAPKSDKALDDMVNTEKQFAQVCAEKGIRDSFLQFFNPDVVTFGQSLRVGTDHLKNRPNNDPLRYKLHWLPTYGDIASSGELGYLTGAALQEDSKGENESWHGEYFSIWTRQPEGWKVAVDFGVSSPTALFKQDAAFVRAPQESRTRRASLATGNSLEAAETEFITKAAANGNRSAICDSASAHIRFYRDNQPLSEGVDGVCKGDAVGVDRLDYKMLNHRAASSGDLGYAYGEYKPAGDQEAKGAYLHVWKRNRDNRWVLVAVVEKVIAK
jgi:ketosteroid isomerase-like protein